MFKEVILTDSRIEESLKTFITNTKNILDSAIKDLQGTKSVYSSETITSIIRNYYESFATFFKISQNKNEVQAAILAELGNELPQSVFQIRSPVKESDLRNTFDKLRHLTIIKIFDYAMTHNIQNTAEFLKKFVDYINYEATISNQTIRNDDVIMRYRSVLITSVSTNNFTIYKIPAILRQKDGEKNLVAAIDFLYKENVVEKNVHELGTFRAAYLELYSISAKEHRENNNLLNKIKTAFDSARELGAPDSFYIQELDKEYYETLKTIIVTTKNIHLEEELLAKLANNSNRNSEVEKARVAILESTYSKLLKKHTGNPNKFTELQSALRVLKITGLDQKVTESNLLAARDAIPNEKAALLREQQEKMAAEAEQKRRAEIAAQEKAEREANNAYENELSALSDPKQYSSVNGELFKEIKTQLLRSVQLQKLSIYGTTHKYKHRQINEYKGELQRATNLDQLKAALDKNPTSGQKYALRANTSFFKTYKRFHAAESTTHELVMKLTTRLDDIIEDVKNKQFQLSITVK